MKKIYTIFIFTSLFFLVGCDNLDQYPKNTISPDKFFKTESDLQMYTNSFYGYLPDGKSIFKGDQESDYAAPTSINAFYLGSYTARDATSGWDWGSLRNINYFLEHYNNPSIREEARNHYAAIARLSRALFYYEKVKRFGNVPWYDKTLATNDPDVYKTQDSREYVMERVLEDLDFACTYLRDVKDESCSMFTQYVALAVKSRICLFEGTFRKYHTYLNLQNSAKKWLKEAADAAEKLMISGQYKLHTSSGADYSYRELFTSETPFNDEIIMAIVYNNGMRQWHDANWWYTSPTYGVKLSLTRRFINTYLNDDGTRFTDRQNYNNVQFVDEMKNRDRRLKQTIRTEGYLRGNNMPYAPDFSATNTGYQPIKYVQDNDISLDSKSQNYNSIPYIRYAEVLLNYAEAKAEQGELTETDWNKTIKLLRERAGIVNTEMPSTVDTYLQTEFFPRISDPLLLEIRRERGVELVLEGNRYDDIRRWRAGDLMTKSYNGIYVPAMNTPYDLNGDGKPDVSFVTSVPGSKVPGVVYYVIGGESTLSNGTNGNLIWLTNKTRYYEDKQYFYPIPISELVLNPNLVQTPGWEE